jgi:hypothetical protein
VPDSRPTALNRAILSRSTVIAALAAPLLLLAACGGGSEEPAPTPTLEATSTSTEEPTASSTPTSGEFARSDDPITLLPVELDVPPITEAPGLVLVDVANSGVITLSPPFTPQPIDFRAGGLLTRDGDEFPLLDIDQGEVARARAYGPLVETSPLAPGVNLEDFDIAPNLAHFVSRRLSEDRETYELVLVRVEDDTRTVVLEDLAPCACGQFPPGRWSASGRFFLEASAGQVSIIDTVEGTVSELSPDAVEPGIIGAASRWSPMADELLVVGPAGLSLLDAATGEAVLVSERVSRFAFTSDGANIVVTEGEDEPLTRVFRRASLDELRSYDGAIEDAVTLGSRVLVALSSVPGCAGIYVTDGVGPVICFEAARTAALSGDGKVAVAYTRQLNVGGRVVFAWSVETLEPATQLRATVLVWTVDALNPIAEDGVYMLWRDDGLVLAVYWPGKPR